MKTTTYPLKQLLALWAQGQLTPEQMIGHLLQHLDALEQRVRQLEQERNRPAQGPPV
jgi:hypothetical protein